MTKRTLLIDGDILAFTIAARVEQKINWGDDIQTRTADMTFAKREAEAWVRELKSNLAADAVIVALSDPTRRYFRHDLFPEYKAGRSHGDTPLLLFDLKAHLRDCEGYKPYIRQSLEADDVLGILATHPTLVGGERIIVTADKDLNQIAGPHFNPRKPKDGIVHITPWYADRFFYQQILTGDPTDGFPGCPGVGPKKADKLLDEAYAAADELQNLMTHEEAVWHYIVAKYQQKGLTEARALQQARVARMLRWTDYDYTNKRPILWTPSRN